MGDRGRGASMYTVYIHRSRPVRMVCALVVWHGGQGQGASMYTVYTEAGQCAWYVHWWLWHGGGYRTSMGGGAVEAPRTYRTSQVTGGQLLPLRSVTKIWLPSSSECPPYAAAGREGKGASARAVSAAARGAQRREWQMWVELGVSSSAVHVETGP